MTKKELYSVILQLLGSYLLYCKKDPNTFSGLSIVKVSQCACMLCTVNGEEDLTQSLMSS
jgi:hypothetical protein